MVEDEDGLRGESEVEVEAWGWLDGVVRGV